MKSIQNADDVWTADAWIEDAQTADAQTADAQTADATILQIDDRAVSAPELLSLLSQYQLLPKLRQEFLIDAAIAPFNCTPEEQSLCCQSFYTQHQLTAEGDRQTWLQQQGMTPTQLVHLATRQLRIEQFKQATWGNKLESYFLQRKSQLDQVVYSLIRVRDVNIAKELYFRLKANEQPFAELAQQYSQGPEAQTGGLIGPKAMSAPHPKLANLLRSRQPGQLSPPFRIEDLWVIVRLEQFLPAQLDESMQQRLLNELFALWLQDQLQKPSAIHLMAERH
ncbi:MAG: peptidylprolyl isomerase [Leptolyngbyaceae cyanobacterium RU_5_1]|nr:peptidylprolyl isomerase [Leptolyngbyaceae cyanobacterium RU_5_1]